MPNTLWRIAFGDYDLAVDRRALTYSLSDTKTGAVWADNRPVGWIELEDAATGERARHDFADARVVSVSEKSGPQGKRLLLGLDLSGIPIDLYFICSQREVQLTVEAARDTRAHRVQEIGLFPGLVSVPDDGASYLVIPSSTGAALLARDVKAADQRFAIWATRDGVTMPFVGAVRCENGNIRDARASLALITDSAYGRFTLSRADDGSASLDTEYERDPERRRLDVRLIVLPEANHVAVARAYRDKLIGERNHITLRRKIRENPAADAVIGAPLAFLRTATYPPHAEETVEDVLERMRRLRDENGVDRALYLKTGRFIGPAWYTFPAGYEGDPEFDAQCRRYAEQAHALGSRLVTLSGHVGVSYETETAALEVPPPPFLLAPTGERKEARTADAHLIESRRLAEITRDEMPEAARRTGADGFLLEVGREPLHDGYPPGPPQSRWEDLEYRMETLAAVPPATPLVGVWGECDWSAVAAQFWWSDAVDRDYVGLFSGPLPLYATVYHDAVVAFGEFPIPPPAEQHQPSRVIHTRAFLRALLSLIPLEYRVSRSGAAAHEYGEHITRTHAVLGPLHRLTFPAFLVEHRFLTADRKVEEAVYSDRTRVVINQSETDDWESDDLHLPPLGFYVRHAKMEAHDARRVGEERFETRAWRIARSRDDQPLSSSADALRQEFPV